MDITKTPSSKKETELDLAEKLFHSGDLFFEHLFIAISHAQKSIDLETYIFDIDELGKKLIRALVGAHQRGVKVRLLLDGAGSSNWNDEEAETCRKQGIELRFFHPLPWQRHSFRIWNYLTLRKITLGLFKLNHRNHRKTCLIDDSIAFIGSMNISARHLYASEGPHSWRDTSLRIEGVETHQLRRAFETAWKYSENYLSNLHLKIKLSTQNFKIRLNHTETHGDQYRHHLIQALTTAKSRIWIANPYFVPDRKLFQAITNSATRGVDVRLIFPNKTDFFPSQFAARSFYQKLLKSGAKVFEYLPTVLHAKVLIIDQWCVVGSSNLNHRSFFRDLEVDVILANPKNRIELSDQFMKDLKNSQEITLDYWKCRSLWSRFLERVFLLFRGIL